MTITILSTTVCPPIEQTDPAATIYEVTAAVAGIGIVRCKVARPDMAIGAIGDGLAEDLLRFIRQALVISGFEFLNQTKLATL